jgi:hypothetical protein
MFFKKAVNCELAVPVPNLLAMCELAIFYEKCDLAYIFLLKDQANKVLYIKFYKYI